MHSSPGSVKTLPQPLWTHFEAITAAGSVLGNGIFCSRARWKPHKLYPALSMKLCKVCVVLCFVFVHVHNRAYILRRTIENLSSSVQTQHNTTAPVYMLLGANETDNLTITASDSYNPLHPRQLLPLRQRKSRPVSCLGEATL